MYLREKLDSLETQKQKAEELIHCINSNSVDDKDDLVKELLNVMDEVQNTLLVLSRVNSQTMISIGQSKIDINTAVIIRNTIKAKIDLISNIIKSDNKLDTLTLMTQREKLLEEYNGLNRAIRLADWGVTLD